MDPKNAAPEPEFDEDEEDAKVTRGDISHILTFLGPYAHPYRKKLYILGVVLLFETAFNLSFPLVMAHLIDDGLVARNWDTIVWVLTFLGFAAVAITILGIISDYIYTNVFSNMVKDIRESLYAHVQKMSMPFFHRTQSGAVLSRFSGDLVATESALITFIPLFLIPLLEVIYSVIVMFMFDVYLGLLGCLIFPLVLWLPRIFTKLAFERAYEKRKMEGVVISAVQENVAAQPVVKAFGLVGRAKRDFAEISRAWVEIAFKGNFSAALVERASHSSLYFVHIIVFGIGVYWVYTGRISVGTLVAFEALFLSMGYALTDVTQYVPNLAHASGAIRNMDDLFSVKPTLADKAEAKTAQPFRETIVFDKVGFWYGEDSGFRMENVDLTIAKGSFVGIVGASGSGKSTMLNLLLRFYDPSAGAVRFDGVDARDYTQESLRAQMGVVFQENFLFNASILDNIRLGKQNATYEEVVAAAKAAEVDETIRGFPDGYDTNVGERGGKLSGGQRQRVAIARALVRDPALLILDEATSALDAVTEAKLNETLLRIARTRTVVSVTHRLGSVEGADHILLLDHGEVVEQGSHDQLMALDGLYAALWRKQRIRQDASAAPAPAATPEEDGEDDEEA